MHAALSVNGGTLADQFWGDRYGHFIDPCGHIWSVGSAQKNMTAQEVEEAGKAMFAKHE